METADQHSCFKVDGNTKSGPGALTVFISVSSMERGVCVCVGGDNRSVPPLVEAIVEAVQAVGYVSIVGEVRGFRLVLH